MLESTLRRPERGCPRSDLSRPEIRARGRWQAPSGCSRPRGHLRSADGETFMVFTGPVPRRSRRRNPLAATCNPTFFLKDLRLGGEAPRTIQNSATITKAGSTRWTNTPHGTGTAIPFLYSRGYKRVSAVRTRAVDTSSSPHEKPRVPFVRANREACVGLETKTLLLCYRCNAPDPKAKNATERQDRRDGRESKKGASMLLSLPAEAEKKWCRLIPTMRPLLGYLPDTRVVRAMGRGLERPLTEPPPP